MSIFFLVNSMVPNKFYGFRYPNELVQLKYDMWKKIKYINADFSIYLTLNRIFYYLYLYPKGLLTK